jgi:hypothetical protein
MEKVEQLLGEFRGDNLAVAGVPDTLAALSNGQVEEMLIVASADGLRFDEPTRNPPRRTAGGGKRCPTRTAIN